MSTNYKNRSKGSNTPYQQATHKIDEEPKFDEGEVSVATVDEATQAAVPEETKDVVTEKTPAPANNARQVRVTVNKLNVRDVPRVPSTAVLMVSKNDLLTTADSLNKEWIAVTTTTGVMGYVMSKFVE